MENVLHFLRFASDAEWLAMVGLAFWAIAAVAGVMERRRLKRNDIQRVGWVPWIGIFMSCAIIGGGMMALGLPKLLAG